jgi:putative ubiquitin-RnfH superfamily antitoxin RatB of RatAB toxin-antitoxin module
MIRVQVAYSPAPREVEVVELSLPPGSTLQHALQASELLARHGLAAADVVPAGIWGRRQPADTPLRDRDRVEIYRPLRCDPKEARRQRFRERPALRKPAPTRA